LLALLLATVNHKYYAYDTFALFASNFL